MSPSILVMIEPTDAASCALYLFEGKIIEKLASQAKLGQKSVKILLVFCKYLCTPESKLRVRARAESVSCGDVRSAHQLPYAASRRGNCMYLISSSHKKHGQLDAYKQLLPSRTVNRPGH